MILQSCCVNEIACEGSLIDNVSLVDIEFGILNLFNMSFRLIGSRHISAQISCYDAIRIYYGSVSFTTQAVWNHC